MDNVPDAVQRSPSRSLSSSIDSGSGGSVSLFSSSGIEGIGSESDASMETGSAIDDDMIKEEPQLVHLTVDTSIMPSTVLPGIMKSENETNGIGDSTGGEETPRSRTPTVKKKPRKLYPFPEYFADIVQNVPVDSPFNHNPSLFIHCRNLLPPSMRPTWNQGIDARLASKTLSRNSNAAPRTPGSALLFRPSDHSGSLMGKGLDLPTTSMGPRNIGVYSPVSRRKRLERFWAKRRKAFGGKRFKRSGKPLRKIKKKPESGVPVSSVDRPKVAEPEEVAVAAHSIAESAPVDKAGEVDAEETEDDDLDNSDDEDGNE